MSRFASQGLANCTAREMVAVTIKPQGWGKGQTKFRSQAANKAVMVDQRLKRVGLNGSADLHQRTKRNRKPK